MTQPIKLILPGTGMLYPALAGSVLAVYEAGYRPTNICGVSGGSIVAAMLASGHSPQEVADLIMDTLPGPNRLLDFNWIDFSRFGLIRGDKILDRLTEHLAPTLMDAYLASGIELDILVVDATTKSVVPISTWTDPHFSLPLAVRASMSIPIVFDVVRSERFEAGVDGGLAGSYPLDFYGPGEGVLGLRAMPMEEGHDLIRQRWYHRLPGLHWVFSLKAYLASIVNTMLASLNREHLNDATYARTIPVYVKGGFLSFNLTRRQAEAMINDAKDQTSLALQALRPESP